MRSYPVPSCYKPVRLQREAAADKDEERDQRNAVRQQMRAENAKLEDAAAGRTYWRGCADAAAGRRAEAARYGGERPPCSRPDTAPARGTGADY